MATLYKRNAAGRPVVWKINIADYTKNYFDSSMIIEHGIVGKDLHKEIIKVTRKSEINSRIEEKRKEGYRELQEIYDNAPRKLNDGDNLYVYLNTYLPRFNSSSTGAILPMLCKTLENDNPFKKNEYLGQYKINGLRCLIGAERSNDMFKPIKLTFQSREGTWWDLSDIEDMFLPYIGGELLDMMIEEGVKLDGELYLPGYKVNNIDSFVKNPTLPQHFNLQYWNYDLAIENTTYIQRRRLLEEFLNNPKRANFNNIEEHLNNKSQYLLLDDFAVNNYGNAGKLRNDFVNLGFEGIVMRNIGAEYNFGKRNYDMMKYKPILDGKFIIVDIIPEGKKRKDLPKFILRNDINSELFECTIKGSFDEQREYLINKNNYIGKYLLVEYRERSGVNDVPFHAKGNKII